jgi:hypothetical protein
MDAPSARAPCIIRSVAKFRRLRKGHSAASCNLSPSAYVVCEQLLTKNANVDSFVTHVIILSLIVD